MNETEAGQDALQEEIDTSCPEGVDPELWDSWQKWEELPADDFRHVVAQGQTGKNVGFGNGLKNLNKYTYGTHKGRYYLIGADSAVGKTTITDFMFVLKAYEESVRTGRKFICYYFSFEISKVQKIARWVSYYIFIKHNLRLPADYITGRIKGKLLTAAHRKMVMEAYDIITKMMKCVKVMDHMVHPTLIFDAIIHEYENYGTVLRGTVTEEEKKQGKKGLVKGFKANEDDIMIMVVVDHIALTNSEKGLDIKGTMDKLSKYAVVLRNLFNTTIVFIQQFSTDAMSTARAMMTKKTEVSITPNRLDFGESKTVFRDACVVLAYTRPNKDLATFMGYNLSTDDGLGKCFIAQYLLKNRYGASDVILPLFIDGVTGYIYDLPLDPRNPIAMQPWYDLAQQIEQICQKFCPVED
jgi:hypothetical protein